MWGLVVIFVSGLFFGICIGAISSIIHFEVFKEHKKSQDILDGLILEIDKFKKTFSKYFEEIVFFPAGVQGGRATEISKKITNKIKNVNENLFDLPEMH